MAKIQDVNIRLMLARLRPSAAYHWKGNSDFGHTMDDVSWRDPSTLKPSEADILAEWVLFQSEETQADALRQALLTDAQSAVGVPVGALTPVQRNALLALLLYNAGGVHPRTGVVQPLTAWVKRE